MQLHHVNQTDHHALIEKLACASVDQDRFSVLIKFRFLQELSDLRFANSVKDGRRHVESERARCNA